jgi:hypothetical protein
LAPEQRTQITARVEALNAARKSYADAMEARDAENNAMLKGLEDQSRAMASQIDERRKQAAAQAAATMSEQEKLQRQQALKERKAELERARIAENDALQDFTVKYTATLNSGQSQSAALEIQKLTTEKAPLEQEVVLQTQQLNDKQAQYARLAYPKDQFDVRSVNASDNRMAYALGSMLGVVFVFVSLILLLGLAGDHPLSAHPLNPDQAYQMAHGLDAPADDFEEDIDASEPSQLPPANGHRLTVSAKSAARNGKAKIGV